MSLTRSLSRDIKRVFEPASLNMDPLLPEIDAPRTVEELAMISGEIPPRMACFDGRGIWDIGLAPACEESKMP